MTGDRTGSEPTREEPTPAQKPTPTPTEASAPATPTPEAVAPEASAPRPMPVQPLWLRAAFALVFGLLLAYDVWEVVGSLLQLLSLGLGFSPLGWAIMIVALLAPIALFIGAFVVSRRRGALVSLLAYATAVAVSGALFSTLTVLLGAVGGVVA